MLSHTFIQIIYHAHPKPFSSPNSISNTHNQICTASPQTDSCCRTHHQTTPTKHTTAVKPSTPQTRGQTQLYSKHIYTQLITNPWWELTHPSGHTQNTTTRTITKNTHKTHLVYTTHIHTTNTQQPHTSQSPNPWSQKSSIYDYRCYTTQQTHSHKNTHHTPWKQSTWQTQHNTN